MSLRAALIAALAAAAPAAAQGETLPGEQVLALISGAWEADPIETPEANRADHRCDAKPEVIRVVEGDAGPRFEYQRGHAEDAIALTSDVRLLTFAVWVQYEQEWRTTPEGDPVEWFFFMPDEDHFFMARRDWMRDGRFNRTTMRRRCPTGPVS